MVRKAYDMLVVFRSQGFDVSNISIEKRDEDTEAALVFYARKDIMDPQKRAYYKVFVWGDSDSVICYYQDSDKENGNRDSKLEQKLNGSSTYFVQTDTQIEPLDHFQNNMISFPHQGSKSKK